MARNWRGANTGTKRRRWLPAAIIALGVLLTAAVAGHGYWVPLNGGSILSYRAASNPSYAPVYTPLCSPCFGPEPIAVSSFVPAYLSHVPCGGCFGNPYGYGHPVGGSTSSSKHGDVTVLNTVNVYQSVVMTPNGGIPDPWNACRCYGALPYGGSLDDLGISQAVKVDIDVDVRE